MKTISIRELKAHWAEVERQVSRGETFEVLNRGRPAALIVPPRPRPVLQWDDHLSTAVVTEGRSSDDIVRADREGRW
ncbi:MAG: type II toxin-antitoxin system prevent-host-death family antitoxin [Spirochaeta sp.]|nr:type II toxin-antitoxin system prevent-host-death family antitoxin [Spirochaeta sp.]